MTGCVAVPRWKGDRHGPHGTAEPDDAKLETLCRGWFHVRSCRVHLCRPVAGTFAVVSRARMTRPAMTTTTLDSESYAMDSHNNLLIS